ncbi:stability determinant [Halomonas sp. 11-S5]|uniref:type II toxin-antitoxin system RelB family antitoxin n=1 Tax=Halomonas sp. 11-S5 TaxID=2994064 RepID=UPI0032AF2ED3
MPFERPAPEIPPSPFAVTDPIVSEFDTQEQADSYDRWFREQIREPPRPSIPHDDVMAEMRELIAAKRRHVAG